MDTTKILLTLVAALALGIMVAYLKLQKKAGQESSYRKRRPLSSTEQAMYWRLVKALPDHVVLAKVALNRCVAIKGAAFDILSRESLDFVVCNKGMQIIAAIELRDANDASESRRNAEKMKEEALEIVGIKLLEWSATPLPSEAFIAMEFYSNINGNDTSGSMTRLAA